MNKQTNSKEKVLSLVSDILDSIDLCAEDWSANNERHGSIELAKIIEEAYGVSQGFSQGIVKMFFENHPSKIVKRGPGGGIINK